MDPNISEINKLIKEAKEPTPTVRAVSILWEMLYKTLYSLALRLTRHPQQSKDIVSDTFSCLLENGIAGFNTYNDIENFLLEQTEAHSLAFLRQVKQEKISVNSLAELQPGDEFVNEEIIQKARELFHRLPEYKQLLIKQQFIDGESAKKTAARMNMDSRAIYVLNHKILNKLRKALTSQI